MNRCHSLSELVIELLIDVSFDCSMLRFSLFGHELMFIFRELHLLFRLSFEELCNRQMTDLIEKCWRHVRHLRMLKQIELNVNGLICS